MGGIWGRAGAVFDSNTNHVYITTANGNFNASVGGYNWGDSVLALRADASSDGLGNPVDSYTPANFYELDIYDIDLGSGALAIVPAPAASAYQHLGAVLGKDAILRLAQPRQHEPPAWTRDLSAESSRRRFRWAAYSIPRHRRVPFGSTFTATAARGSLPRRQAHTLPAYNSSSTRRVSHRLSSVGLSIFLIHPRPSLQMTYSLPAIRRTQSILEVAPYSGTRQSMRRTAVLGDSQ